MKNKKGFTLIELLAVIVILGILMLVAIPAVSRTIENARRDTFLNTAKSYINAVKNAVAADEIYCLSSVDTSEEKPISSAPNGKYYYGFDSAETTGKDLMEQGGKSSWANRDVQGYVSMEKTVDAQGRTTYVYSIEMVDSSGRGIGTRTVDSSLARSDVKTTGNETQRTAPEDTEEDPTKKYYACKIVQS